MELLTPEQVARVFDVTDRVGLHRNFVVVPLAGADVPLERILPDGKVLIRPPAGGRFEGWLEGLSRRLENLELDRVPRTGEHDPRKTWISPSAPPGSGSRRYLNWLENDAPDESGTRGGGRSVV